MLEGVRGGKLSVEDAVERLRTLPYEDLGYAKIDHHRSLRQGFPEVVFARGKAPEQVKGIVEHMLRNKHNILVTRGDRALYEVLRPLHPKMEFHALSGAISIRQDKKIRGKGKVLVVCAGTSDIPVAEEALVTATVMGNRAEGALRRGRGGDSSPAGRKPPLAHRARHHLRGGHGRRIAQRGGRNGGCARNRRSFERWVRRQFPWPCRAAGHAEQLLAQRLRGEHR